MNWQRVKMILIMGLLASNLVIGYFIVQKQAEDVTSTPEERLELISSIMEMRSIGNLVKDLPAVADIPKINIKYESLDLDAIAKNFFDGDYYSEGGMYYSDDYKFELVDNGSILYVSRTTPIKKAPPITLNMAKNTAQNFITDDLGFKNDYYYSAYSDLGDTVRLEYVQRYDDYFIDNTYMRIVIDGDGVVSVERKWLTVNEIERERIGIIDYSDALFKALDLIEQAKYELPLDIKSVKLGYGLKDNVFGTNIKSGEAMPYYRFYLSNLHDVTVPALKVD